MIAVGRTALLIALIAWAAPGSAHGDLHQQIVVLGEQIKADPGNALLVLRRADLNREHGDLAAAKRDYGRAQSLMPTLAAVHLGRGKLLAVAGQAAAAEQELSLFLRLQPTHVEGLATRASVRAGMGRHRQAADDLTRAISASPAPQPEHYVDRAQSLLAIEPPAYAQALQGLEAGLTRLGPVAGLEQLALDIETRAGHYDAALQRIERLAAGAARKEAWQERRGDILVAAGRIPQAQAAYGQALQSLLSLPVRLRNTAAMQRLHARLLAKQAGSRR